MTTCSAERATDLDLSLEGRSGGASGSEHLDRAVSNIPDGQINKEPFLVWQYLEEGQWMHLI